MARLDVCAPAIVLRTVDYGDRDRIVTMLVAGHGRRAAMAKGARASRKRFAGALEPLRVIEASYIDRDPGRLATLTRAEVVEHFAGIEASFDKTSLASYATELSREIARDGHPDDDLLNLLVSHFRALNRCDDDLESLESWHQHFVLTAMQGAGFLPALGVCGRCGRTVDDSLAWRFLPEAGAVCARCRRPGGSTPAVEAATLQHLAASCSAPAPAPDGRTRDSARSLLRALVHGMLGRDLKSTAFLDMVLR
jgi:DNA repair protein RecO (recombination protein O)